METLMQHPDLFMMETLLFTACNPEPGYTGLFRSVEGSIRMTKIFNDPRNKPDGCFFYVEHRARTINEVREAAKAALKFYNEGLGIVH